MRCLLSFLVGALCATLPLGVALAQEDHAQEGPASSPVKSDEEVILFPTYAVQDPETSEWTAAIHGWIFEPEPDSIWRGLSAASLRTALGLSQTSLAGTLFEERSRWFLLDNERGKEVPILVAGRTVVCEPSGASGHFHGLVKLTEAEIEQACGSRGCQGGILPSQVVLPAADTRQMTGAIHLVTPRGLSVISDIDDTVKVSEVTDKKALLANTFLRPYVAVDGMASLFTRWQGLGASFHYVSASPWQLTSDLQELLLRAGLPAGTLHLKAFRWKDQTALQILTSSQIFKPPILKRILQAYPDRRFLLVGDSGEHDPAIYGGLAREFPEQIVRIYIRNVTGEAATSPRLLEAFRDVPPDRWQLFDEPSEVTFGREK